MPVSSPVTGGTQASASDVNDIRTDALNLLALVGSEKTISSDQIILDTGVTAFRVDTQGDAAIDDLDSILGGADGDIIVISPASLNRRLEIQHAGSSIGLASGVDSILHDIHDHLLLLRDPTVGQWNELVSTPAKTGWVKGQWASSDSWDYVSATQIQIPNNDYTNILFPGMKLVIEQSGTLKYFYIVDVSYSSPNTTITVTGGSDYTVANASIAKAAYSMADSPQGFPAYFNWTPTLSASGSMTWTSTTILFAVFRIVHGWVFISLEAYGTTGGSASTALHATPPTSPVGDVSGGATGSHMFACSIGDGGGALAGVGFTSNGATQLFARKSDGSNFGLGTLRRMIMQGSYPLKD